jgi:hypothetical protein
VNYPKKGIENKNVLSQWWGIRIYVAGLEFKEKQHLIIRNWPSSVS